MTDLKQWFASLDTLPAPSLEDVLSRDRIDLPARRPGRRPLLIAASLLIAAVGLALAATMFIGGGSRPPSPAGAVSKSEIVFAGGWGGDWALYAADWNGSHERKIAQLDELSLMMGSRSPDGTRLAYATGISEVHVVNLDGSGTQRAITHLLPEHVTVVSAPRWSPDGSRIAFTANGFKEETPCPFKGCYSLLPHEYLYVMNADGSDLTRVGGGEVPSWSPDGLQIAFARRGSLWIVEADGSGQHQVTARSQHMLSRPLAWSPDGRSIAFSESDETAPPRDLSDIQPGQLGPMAIYAIGVDRTGYHRLSRGADPVWSPDGKLFVFMRPDDGVYVMRPNGTHVERVARTTDGVTATWAPNGRVAYGSWGITESGIKIHLVKVDGSHPTVVTLGRSAGRAQCCPIWLA